ncbi:MAG: hypothetical protein IJY89_03550, partial [Clostridia bacterium]|nr:hypothetical protein [Clostridia bacterium]
KCTLRWIHPEFEGGTYNKATEDKAKEEAAKKEEESKTSASASASTSEKEEEKKAGYQLKIGSDSFIDGFEDGLIGLSVATNTKKTLSLTFPNPYTSNKALSGVDVEFDVTILSVTEEIKRDPETQWDELKHDIVEEKEDAAFDFKNVGEYKAFVEEAKKMDLVATKMLYGSTMKKFPASDYKEYKQNYENYLYQQMFMQYFYTTYSTSAPELSTLVTKYGGFKSLDAYYQHIADQAALNLKRDLALYQVAKKEGLTKVTAEDIEEYINYSNTLSCTKTLTTENFNESFGGKDEANKTVVIYKAQKFLAEKAPVVTVK